jgi:AcrR family transcriptional regulator
VAIETDTRTQLLEATMDAISLGGESSVRVGAIAAAAGVREPSVYHFFKNREALVEAAHIERYRRSFVEYLKPFEVVAHLAETQADFERGIRKILAMIYGAERAEVRSVRMSVMGAAQSNPSIAVAVSAINHEVAASLAEVVTFSQERGWFTKDLDALAVAYWVLGQIQGRVMSEMDPAKVDLDAWDKVSIEAVVAILKFSGPEVS